MYRKQKTCITPSIKLKLKIILADISSLLKKWVTLLFLIRFENLPYTYTYVNDYMLAFFMHKLK